MLQCPVRNCNAIFRSIRHLCRHLQSVTKKRKCGLYKDFINFVCRCGTRLNTVAGIKRHATVRHRRHKNTKCAFINVTSGRTAIEPGFYLEQNEDDFDFIEDDLDDIEGGGVESQRPLSLVTLLHNATGIITNRSSFNMWAFVEASAEDSRLSALSALYGHCLASRLSTRNYRDLVSLGVIDKTMRVPKTLNGLRSFVIGEVHDISGWISIESLSLHGYPPLNLSPTPYITVETALQIWMSIPQIVDNARDFNKRYLPADLVDIDLYDELTLQRTDRIRRGIHYYEHVADGTSYLESVKDNIPIFLDSYVQACEDDIETLVLPMAFYEDGFSKNKDSLVKQNMFCLTLVDAIAGDASLCGLSSLIMMVADSNGVATLGRNEYWRVLIDSMKRCEKGIRMLISGRPVLLICVGLALMADTLALKEMMGLSPSISSTCYVRMPCRSCSVVVDDLQESIHDQYHWEYRTLETFTKFYELNHFKTGPPLVGWVRESMKDHGMNNVSEFVRLNNGILSPHKLGGDTLHMVYLGTMKQHFIQVVTKLTSAPYSNKSIKSTDVWRKLSAAFKRYCSLNRITACWKFASFNQFRMRIKGGSMRELGRASLHILHEIGLVSITPWSDKQGGMEAWKKHIRIFNFWILHVHIVNLLEKHLLSAEDVCDLELMIKNLLNYFYSDFPKSFVTMNVHHYLHFVDQIKWLGPMRLMANNSREALIPKMKTRFKNTSKVKKEYSVFRCYTDEIYFQIQRYLQSSTMPCFNRDNIPQPLVTFSCSRYNRVLIAIHGRVLDSLPENEQLQHDCTKGVQIKLNYQCLKKMDYLLLDSGFHFQDSYCGVFIDIVYYRGDPYIAHCIPRLSLRDVYEGTSYELHTVSKDIDSTLYLCPLSSFLKRLMIIQMSGAMYALIDY